MAAMGHPARRAGSSGGYGFAAAGPPSAVDRIRKEPVPLLPGTIRRASPGRPGSIGTPTGDQVRPDGEFQRVGDRPGGHAGRGGGVHRRPNPDRASLPRSVSRLFHFRHDRDPRHLPARPRGDVRLPGPAAGASSPDADRRRGLRPLPEKPGTDGDDHRHRGALCQLGRGSPRPIPPSVAVRPQPHVLPDDSPPGPRALVERIPSRGRGKLPPPRWPFWLGSRRQDGFGSHPLSSSPGPNASPRLSGNEFPNRSNVPFGTRTPHRNSWGSPSTAGTDGCMSTPTG